MTFGSGYCIWSRNCKRYFGFCLFFAFVFIEFTVLLFGSHATYAIAKESTLSLSISSHSFSMEFLPSPGGTFSNTTTATITINTDNYTGYSFSLYASDNNGLKSENDDVIPPLQSEISESTFRDNASYNNRWGYKPSQYVSSVNSVNTVVSNNNYLPPPTTNGSLIDITDSANSSDNTYSLSFGARVDSSQPPGTYIYTYEARVIANTITYNVTYNQNTNETVTNMPSPNPQALQIDGGTPTAESYATLSDAVPTMTTDDMSFGGWCTVATTIDSTTGNYECSGTTYQAGDDYPIDQTSSATNIMLYAIWLNDTFPVKWSQMGKCVFNNGTISGSECQDYVNDDFIDTGIALYSNDNYQKDYEVHFTIDTYNPNSQTDSQATIFNDKLSSSVTGSPYGGKSPGIIVRNTSSKTFEIKSTYGAPTDNVETRTVTKTPYATAYAGTDVRIFRIDGHIYTSIDNGPLVLLQDYTSFNQQFGLTAWFGAYPDNVDCSENCSAAKRYFTGELSNMYIKLGDMPSDGVLDITFNANGGSPSTTVHKILNGNALSEFPEVTNSGWLFDGWWTASSGGQQVSSSTVPTADTTYYAHWYKSVNDAQITNSSISLSVNGTETISITNAADIEPYTLVSSDTSVATVSSAGVITAVGSGNATITLTGTKTGDTRTISVAVGSIITVNFYSQGGSPSTFTEPIASGNSFSSLPEPSKPGYKFEGWYTGANGTGTQLTTSTIFNANTPTQYYANWEELVYVCKIATELHEEACNQTDSNGCKGTSFPNNTITYGSLVNNTTLTAGNAFNCDIDYDGAFDEETERFYYFGTENGNAKFVYYKSMQETSAIYTDALALLPTSSDPGWDNPNLVTFSGDYNGSVARFMTYPEALALCDNATSNLGINGRCLYLLEKSAFANTTITDGIWLEKQPSYNNRIQTRSRGLTHGNTTSNAPRPTIEVPVEYVEPYVEPVATYDITFDPHNGGSNTTETVTAGTALGNKYPSPDPTYTDHIFQGWYTAVSGGTLVTDQTIPDGDWTYHAQWEGSVALAQVDHSSITLVEGNTVTIQVSNAADIEAFTCSSSDNTIATVDASTCVVSGVGLGTATISITGAESHTINSNIVTIDVVDASSAYRVTFDPRNGDSTSFADIAIGHPIDGFMPPNPTYTNHVFQRWYDTSNNNTVTSATEVYSAMTVYAEWKLDVTQAVISNADLTLSAGDQLAILVNNSAQLESYVFSSADSSIATVNANTGVITGVSAGTVNIIMTGTQSNLTKFIEVAVTPAPVIKRTVTFNANGGSTPTPAASFQVDDGDPVGNLPTTSRSNYEFFGWYTDDGTFYEEVTPETTVDADVTYYAKWVEDTSSFPIIWSEVNACTFSGNRNVSGTYCSADNKTKKYIDTAIQLFTQANYYKDFEVGFTVVDYDPASNNNQATFVNSKQENSANNYPGFVVRRYTSTNNIEVTEKWKDNGDGVSLQFLASSVHTVKVARRIEEINGTDHIIMYYSINNGALTPLQDITDVTHIFFDTAVWFGASATSDNTMQRPFVGTLTDMYIKLGEQTDYLIYFNPGNGSFTNASDSNRTIPIDDPLGSLPVPNPPSNNHTFIGWFDESTSPATQVTASTVPSSNMTYVAHYSYQSSDTPALFDVSNNATRGYQNLIDGWVESPVNITTFNKATPINDSTWGDTSELPELEFWQGIRSNFVDNHCMIPSYSDAAKPLSSLSDWTNGSVDCSKPDAYDTDIGAALTVRLNNAQGAVVTYAKADNGVIHNMIPGQTYYWEKSDDSSVYGYVTAISNKGTRWVDTGTIRNVRDLGGLPVTYTDGNNQTVTGTVAYGRLFRGEKLNSAPATELTNLGITTEYNVGDEYSGDTHLTDYHLNQVIHYDFDYHSGDESNPNSNYMKAWTAVTNIMMDITDTNTTKNVYFHCRVGADRTGTVAYLLEGLLGVPDEMRYEEYALTNVSGLYDRTRYYKKKADDNANKFVYMMGYVKTNQDIYDWYMQNSNASTSLIQSFRAAMTVPTSGGNQQNNVNVNNTRTRLLSNDSDDNNSSSVETNTNDGHSSPLGVSETVYEEENIDTISDTDVLVVAATAIGSGLAISYALTKKLEDDETESN